MNVDIDEEMKKMLGITPSEYVEIQEENKHVDFLSTLGPEVREARNYLTFYGFIPCNPETPSGFGRHLFQPENWIKEKIINKHFNKTQIPEDGKYVYVDTVVNDNSLYLVCVCNATDEEKYRGRIIAALRSYFSFLNIYDKDNNKLYLRVEDDGRCTISLGDKDYYPLMQYTKPYGNKVAITYQIVPLSNIQLAVLGLQYVEEKLEDIDEEVEIFVGFNHG
jgi:hypothetical protein